MRALREQPRLVVAKLVIALAVVAGAVLVGSALASDGADPPLDLRPRLERSQQLGHAQALELDRASAHVKQLRRQLRAATQRAGVRARETKQLRDSYAKRAAASAGSSSELPSA